MNFMQSTQKKPVTEQKPDFIESALIKVAIASEGKVWGIYSKTWIILLTGTGIILIGVIAGNLETMLPKYAFYIRPSYIVALLTCFFAGCTQYNVVAKIQRMKGGHYVR